jgi:hypothetical protein
LAFCLVGIGLWIGVTVLVAVVNDDPSDGGPVVLAFAAGAAVFFGIVFGVALWQTRPHSDPELDALLAELSLEPQMAPRSARAIGGMRRVARAYIVLGALVTGLGLAAIVQEGLGLGSPRTTVYVLVAVVVVWALAVPFVLRRANAASRAVLTPLGLSQNGASLTGERRGRRVAVRIDPKGSVTEVDCDREAPALEGAEILAYAGRGDERTWAAVRVDRNGEWVRVRRDGHEGASWLWDLWLAERLASEPG